MDDILLLPRPGGCLTNVSRALQYNLSKFAYCRNHTSYENFKLKLCTCAQNHALGTRTKFQLEILTINVISGIVYFRKIILESSRNVNETTPWHWINLVFSGGHGLKDTFIEYSFTHWKYLNSIICHCIWSNKLCRFIYIAIAFAETKYLN